MIQIKFLIKMKKKNILIFGANGSIGSSICKRLMTDFNIIAIVRNTENILNDNAKNLSIIKWDVLNEENIPDELLETKVNAICWSQGINFNDSIKDFTIDKHIEMYKVNCLFILKSLNLLIKNNLLTNSAKMCVISSIWQNIARQDKMSYSISKSAIVGIVNSLAVDLAEKNCLINAILPGVTETNMTHKNLSKSQIDNVKQATNFNRLSNINDIGNLVYYLCSDANTSITGQFINIDLGYSNVRVI